MQVTLQKRMENDDNFGTIMNARAGAKRRRLVGIRLNWPMLHWLQTYEFLVFLKTVSRRRRFPLEMMNSALIGGVVSIKQSNVSLRW